MTEHPMIFSAPMVRALLDGRKSMTRRVLKPQPDIRGRVDFGTVLPGQRCVAYRATNEAGNLRLRYAPGDRIWVRESFCGHIGHLPSDFSRPALTVPQNGGTYLFFKCDDDSLPFAHSRWRSPIHMPRWASRLTLVVTDVRVQRLNELTDDDAIAEGATSRPRCNGFRSAYTGWSMDWSQIGKPSRYSPDGVLTASCISLGTPAMAFASYWNSLHGPDAWGRNEWVAALTFQVHRCNIDQMEAEP